MKQKRKILLCALSFIAVALFSCGIAFLPLDAFSPSNENQETTEARDEYFDELVETITRKDGDKEDFHRQFQKVKSTKV